MAAGAEPETDPAILAIMNDSSLNPIEKARKKQALVNARVLASMEESDDEEEARCSCRIHLRAITLSSGRVHPARACNSARNLTGAFFQVDLNMFK